MPVVALPKNPSQKQVKKAIEAFRGAPAALANTVTLNPGNSVRLNDDAMTNPTTFMMEVYEIRWAMIVTIQLAGAGGV